MSKKLYEESNIQDIADAIREKNGEETTYKVSEMAQVILDLPSSKAVVEPLNVTQNGTYTAPSGVDGYSPVVVNVSGGGGGSILTGRDTPSASLGSDGDVYKQVIPISTNINFVEYLQSSGTQYINTGIYPTESYGVYAEVYRLDDDWIAGSRQSDYTSNGLNVVGNRDDSNGLSLDYAGTRYNTSVSADQLNVIKFIPDLTVGGGYAALRNGTKYWFVTKAQAYTLTNPIILFGIGKSDSIEVTPAAKIKRCALFDGLTCVADYLPCLDRDGVACMWDNIAGQYVYNDGTGDFAYGDAVTPAALDPVYYVKKNGAWEVMRQ